MNLIVDISILIHANYYIIKKYANKVDAVGLANKVINQVDNLIILFQKDHDIRNVICIGDHRKNFRKSIYKDYKGHRSNKKELNELKDQVLDFIASKLDLIVYKGLEADDIIYLYVGKYVPNIIVTNDMDLLQCVSTTTKVYLYQKQELVDTESLNEVTEYIVLEKCLLGDVSDNIKRSVRDKMIRKDLIKRVYNGINTFDTKTILKEFKAEGVNIDKKLFKLNRLLIEFNIKTYKKYIPKFDKFYKQL